VHDRNDHREVAVEDRNASASELLPLRYRLEVEGEVGPEWASWFDARAVRAADGRTVIELEVTDQAQLHGLVRRVLDLHLRLVSLIRRDAAGAGGDR
jgi:hypothetical protein